MKNILAISCLWALLSIPLSAAPAFAEVEDLIKFDLSLAGYQLGMSYDAALQVRFLNISQDTGSEQPAEADHYFDAFANHVYVNDIEMNLWLRFRNQRLFKIIARFPTEQTETFARSLQQALGRGVDESRQITTHDGSIISQTVYFWDYPCAKLYLIKASNNTEYATVGLTAKETLAEKFFQE